jgi:hypothetical protein
MQDEREFPTVQLRRERSPLSKIILGAGILGLLFFLSLIVQSFLGDTYLSGEGGLWQAAVQTWCGVASWAPNCGPNSSAAPPGSTSTSTSLSTSTSAR